MRLEINPGLPLKVNIDSLYRWSKDQRGGVAVIFALVSFPLIIMTGGVIDYAHAVEKRTALQRALDLGVLSAASNARTSSAYLQNIVCANLVGNNISISNATMMTAPSADGGVTYQADVNIDVPTYFLNIIGLQKITVTARAEATVPAQIVTVKFTPTNTSGAYSKDIFIWTKNAIGAVTSQQTVLTYRYDSSTGSKVTTPPIGTQTFTINVPLYATYGMGMVTYVDKTNYSGALINPVELWSDAPNSAVYLRQSGDCSMSTGATYNWEDGGDSNYMDFVYTMTCTRGVAVGAGSRLSK